MRITLPVFVFIIAVYSATVILAQTEEADLAIAVLSDETVIPRNTNFTYQITVENQGPADVTFVTVSGTLPEELAFLTSTDCVVAEETVTCAIGDIPAGETVVVSYQARATTAGLAAHAVTVTAAETDPDLTNNSAAVAVEVVVPQAVDITLAGSVTPAQVDMGELVTLDFALTNTGAVPAYRSTLELILPPQLEFVAADACTQTGAIVTCTAATVPIDAPVTLTLSTRAVAPGDPIQLTAIVSHLAADPDVSNNGTTISLTVNDPPPESADLQLSIGPAVDYLVVGEPVAFTFTVINAGPAAATGVQISSQLPAELTFIASPDCVPVDDLIVCEVGDLALNTIYTGIVTLQAAVAAPAITLSVNTAGDNMDPNTANNATALILASTASVEPPPTEANPPGETAAPAVTPTITATPTLTSTPTLTITSTPTATPTSESSPIPAELAATQPAPPPTNNDGPTGGGAGGNAGGSGSSGNTAPSDIYGWTRHESIELIQVTGRWALRTMSNASAGAYHESRDPGATLRFPFEGDGFRIGFRSDVLGSNFEVYLDGQYLTYYVTDAGQIDFLADAQEPRLTLVSLPQWITPGYHVIDLVCLADGTQGGCNIDYVEVFVGPPIPDSALDDAQIIDNVELISAPPTIVPTATPPPPAVISVDVLVNVDLNANDQIEPDEGVAGITVQAVDIATNTVLATVTTDNVGLAQVNVVTNHDVVILIPLLGESFYVRNRGNVTTSWPVILAAANVPGLLP